MANLRATEMWYGRERDPADVVDTVAAPVSYVPPMSRYGIPPLSSPDYDPLQPYPPMRPPVLPLYDPLFERGAGPALRPPPPQRDFLPPYEIPADMVIPGVQHPDGRFEPHPLYARRAPPSHHDPPPPDHVEAKPPVESKPADSKVVELAVPVCCEACEERVANYLKQSDGVEKVECDIPSQKVKVTGDIAPADALELCKRCFKRSALV